MTSEELDEAVPPQALMDLVNARHDALVSSLARANATGIAACLAASFQELPVAFPLGCFLLGALGYGLHQLGQIFSYSEVTTHYVRLGAEGFSEMGMNWVPKFEIREGDEAKWRRRAFYWETFGLFTCVAFFIVGVLAGFVVIAF